MDGETQSLGLSLGWCSPGGCPGQDSDYKCVQGTEGMMSSWWQQEQKQEAEQGCEPGTPLK